MKKFLFLFAVIISTLAICVAAAPVSGTRNEVAWSYEDGSQKMEYVGKKDHSDMFAGIKEAYNTAFKAVGADILIPSGYAFDLLQNKGFKVHRDTFHAKYGFGRYALSLTWMKTLFGKDVTCGNFDAFDEPVTDEERSAAEECASEACTSI